MFLESIDRAHGSMALVQPKIGFHTAGSGGNPTGITEDYINPVLDAGKDVAIVCADGAVGLLDACIKARVVGNTTSMLCWRQSDQRPAGGFDFDALGNDFTISPEQAAVNHHSEYVSYFPPELEPYIDLLWVKVLNEIRGQNTGETVYQGLHIGEWLGRFALHYRKLTDWKIALFGFASGEPDIDVWEQPSMLEYLRICAERPQDTAVALNEYSFNVDDIFDGFPYKVGRFNFLHDVCDAHGIPRPPILVPEFGWALDNVTSPERAIEDYDAVHLVTLDGEKLGYAYHPNVLGLGTWWLGPDFGGVADKAQKLIKPVGTHIVNTMYDVEIDRPPIGPPTPPPNLLRNPSFEEGHYDLSGSIQVPNEWTFSYTEGDSNPHSEWPFVAPEVRVLPAHELPPEERDLFVLDGDYTVKAFKGNGAWNGRFEQTLAGLPNGQYRLTVPVFADLVKGYNEDGSKIWADDPSGLDGLVRVLADDQPISEWTSLAPGQLNELEFIFPVQGDITVGIEFMCPFPLANSGFFCDDWTLENIEANGGNMPTYKNLGDSALVPAGATHVRVAFRKREKVDSATVQLKWRQATDYLPIPTDSNDVMLVWFQEVPAEPENPNPPEFSFSAWPTDHKVITQEFGNNPEYYDQFDLPGHEGVDIRAPHGSNIYAVADGEVYEVKPEDGHNYGVRVRIRSGKYRHIYAHLLDVAVSVGDSVVAGQVIGRADDTGNSFGSHLHLTLKSDDARDGGEDYIGYPYDIVDPTPYLLPFNPERPSLPTPPTGETINLAWYQQAEPHVWRVVKSVDAAGNEHGQDVQDMDLGNGRMVMRKNSDGEWYRFENGYRLRERDSSPGDGRLYIMTQNGLEGGRVNPESIVLGETWTDSTFHHVQFYSKDGCVADPLNSGDVVSFCRATKAENVTFNTYGQNLTFDEVVYLETNNGETQMYGVYQGVRCGWIGWTSDWGTAEPVEIHFGRGVMTEEPKRYC